MGKSSINGPFSTAMLNNQRVIIPFFSLNGSMLPLLKVLCAESSLLSSKAGLVRVVAFLFQLMSHYLANSSPSYPDSVSNPSISIPELKFMGKSTGKPWGR